MTAKARALAVALAGLVLGAAGEPARPGPDEGGGCLAVRIEREGSLGRGELSCALALAEARKAGADRVYLAAADRLLDPRRTIRRWSLDADTEPVDAGEAWRSVSGVERTRTKRVVILQPRTLTRAERSFGPDDMVVESVYDGVELREGDASLRLALSGSNTEAFRTLGAMLTSEQDREQRPLALATEVHLHLRPEAVGRDGRPFVELRFSRHAEGAGQRLAQLKYVFTVEPLEPWTERGTVFLPVTCTPGEWNAVILDVGADVARLSGGRDNALTRIVVGVESRFQAPVEARFDEVRLVEAEGPREPLAAAREVLAAAAESSGTEARLALLHDGLRRGAVLALGGLAELREHALLSAVPAEAVDTEAERSALAVELLEQVVAEVREDGGLAVLDNALAPPFHRPALRAERTAELIETGLFGAEALLLDAGEPTLADQLEVWDALLDAGLRTAVVGSGGKPMERSKLVSGVFSLVTYVRSDLDPNATGRRGRDPVLAQLAAGRGTLADPAAFRGAVDLVTERGFRMGQVVLTDRPSVRVRLVGLDRPLEPRGEVRTFRWVTPEAVWSDVELEEGALLELSAVPAYVRAELQGRRAEPVAFSNALCFVRAWPAEGVALPRAGFDLGGVRCLGGDGALLLGAAALQASSADGAEDEPAAAVRFELRVEAGAAANEGAELELWLDREGPAEVSFDPPDALEGRVEQEGSRLRLAGLRGAGSVLVRQAR